MPYTGSNAADGWELTARDLAVLASYVNRGGAEETSFDDLFDDPAYRAAQTSFAGHAHHLKPHGQTHYRPVVEYATQGLPGRASSAHWDYLPDSGAQRHAVPHAAPRAVTRPTMHAGNRLAWAAAHASARPESGNWSNNFGSNPRPLPGYERKPVAAQHHVSAPPQGPSVRTYHFAG